MTIAELKENLKQCKSPMLWVCPDCDCMWSPDTKMCKCGKWNYRAVNRRTG